MAIFHVEGKTNFTMLVGDEEFVQFMEKCLCAMFGFLLGSVHVSKDVACGENNVVISSIYQLVPSSGPQGLQWMVENGMYQTIGKSLVRSSQDAVFTSSTTTSIVNCVILVIEIKVDPDDQPVHSKSSKPIQDSTFVDLGDSFDDDGNFGSILT
jgi:hypothetical protein